MINICAVYIDKRAYQNVLKVAKKKGWCVGACMCAYVSACVCHAVCACVCVGGGGEGRGCECMHACVNARMCVRGIEERRARVLWVRRRANLPRNTVAGFESATVVPNHDEIHGW